MRRASRITVSFIALACGLAMIPAAARARQPATALTAGELAERTLHRRAVEAAIWGMPVVNTDAMYQAMVRDAKGGVNQIGYFSRPSDWKNQTTTPSAEVLYILFFTNTKETGPLVLEVPSAGDAVLFGSLLDVWQVPLEDVGPKGADAGKGGKYLWLPPGYTGVVPPGYIPVPSQTYQGYALLRTVPKSWSAENIQRSVAYIKQLKLYPLSQAAAPPPTRFVDLAEVVYEGLPTYDVRFYEALNRVVQEEPVQHKDLMMMDMLRSIGIEKGAPFRPDQRTANILSSAVEEAHAWFENRWMSAYPAFYTGKHWLVPAEPVATQTAFTWEKPDWFATDARGMLFYFGYAPPKKLGAATFYLLGQRDGADQPLQGAKAYRLHVPPNVPMRQFWSVDVYDVATAAFIRESPRVGLSSFVETLQRNRDGSVDIYFGPRAPAGKADNWIFTKSGGRFFLLFRFYGPEPPLFDKTWQLPDLEPLP